MTSSALRQAEAFARSVLRVFGIELAVPDHTTLSRRGRGFAGRQPRVARRDGPVHLVLDSTGLQLFGQGEWEAEKHGRARRQWRKLHRTVAVDTGEIAAHVLTDGNADDAAQAPALLRQVEGSIASVTADGRRNHVETAIGRYKHLIAPKLRARTQAAQQGEAAIAVAVLHRMIRAAKPVSVRRT